MLVQSWQDEQVGSRAVHLLERLDVPWKFIGMNGDHGEYYGDDVFPHILRFLQYHLKQEIPAAERAIRVPVRLPNGLPHPTKTRPETFEEALARYQDEDDVRINWENGAGGGRTSAWSQTFATWPVPDQRPWRLQLGADGSLRQAGAPAGSVPYDYVPEVGSQQRGEYTIDLHEEEIEDTGTPLDGTEVVAGTPPASWSDRPPDGTSASFTTAALDADKVLLGSASLDLLVSSTAPDTDFEVTLSEVRSDGNEVFVQQGWLRASHRKEDPTLSTALRPFQTHTLVDAVNPLVPSVPTPMRIELFPFGHVFRAGSRIRITVAAPHTHPDLWGFVSLPVPAVNTIHTGPGASSLVLPLVDGATAGVAALPPCTLRNQPCRAEP
jgi:hypothetical protein